MSFTDGLKEAVLSSPVKLNLPPPAEFSMPPPPVQFNQQQQQILMQHIQQQQQQQNIAQNPGSGIEMDDEEARKRKAPYSKPIPKDFEKAWTSNLSMNPQSSAILQMASIVIDPITKIPSLTLPPNMMQPPPNLLQTQIPNSGNLNVPPPNMLTPMMNMLPPILATQSSPPDSELKSPSGNQDKNNSDKQPSRLMDLMSTGNERNEINQSNGSFKRKLSQGINSEDTDDRNWTTGTSGGMDESQIDKGYGNNSNNNQNNHQGYNNYRDNNISYNNRRGTFDNRRGGKFILLFQKIIRKYI